MSRNGHGPRGELLGKHREMTWELSRVDGTASWSQCAATYLSVNRKDDWKALSNEKRSILWWLFF